MVESSDRFFLRPRHLLSANRVGLYDAINLVVYANLPLITALKGKELVAGFAKLDEFGAIKLSRSIYGEDELLGKYAKEIAALRFPIAPSQYESLLDSMCPSTPTALPYFYHEHHLIVDKRRRAALFARLYSELGNHVSKGDVILQLTESERTYLLESHAWMTRRTLCGYLDLCGVSPWWENEENLSCHERVERVLLSDGLRRSGALTPLEGRTERQELPELDISNKYQAQDSEKQRDIEARAGGSQEILLIDPSGETPPVPVDISGRRLHQQVTAVIAEPAQQLEVGCMERHPTQTDGSSLQEEPNASDMLSPPHIRRTDKEGSKRAQLAPSPQTLEVEHVFKRGFQEDESYDEQQLPSFLLARTLVN